MSPLSDNAVRITTDEKTRFPLMEIEEVGSLTLWPITKIQFEMYITEVNQYGDCFYEEILQRNPRISYQQFHKKDYERLFITGLSLKEIHAFSTWFGKDFGLPTLEEYLKIFQFVDNQAGFIPPPDDLSPPAKKIWQGMEKISKSPIQFSLLKDGFIEWVKNGNSYEGRGAPRSHILPNALNPLKDSVKLIKSGEQFGYQGFRLLRRNGHE